LFLWLDSFRGSLSEVARWTERLIGYFFAIDGDLIAVEHKLSINFSGIEHCLFSAPANGL
jgi:hypothetical protein